MNPNRRRSPQTVRPTLGTNSALSGLRVQNLSGRDPPVPLSPVPFGRSSHEPVTSVKDLGAGRTGVFYLLGVCTRFALLWIAKRPVHTMRHRNEQRS